MGGISELGLEQDVAGVDANRRSGHLLHQEHAVLAGIRHHGDDHPLLQVERGRPFRTGRLAGRDQIRDVRTGAKLVEVLCRNGRRRDPGLAKGPSVDGISEQTSGMRCADRTNLHASRLVEQEEEVGFTTEALGVCGHPRLVGLALHEDEQGLLVRELRGIRVELTRDCRDHRLAEGFLSGTFQGLDHVTPFP